MCCDTLSGGVLATTGKRCKLVVSRAPKAKTYIQFIRCCMVHSMSIMLTREQHWCDEMIVIIFYSTQPADFAPLCNAKGKERGLYSAYRLTTSKALICGSHRVTCKYTTSAFPSYKHSLEGDTAQFHPASYTDILLIPHPTEGRRLSWPGWLTHSGRLTHEGVTRQPWIRRRSGKVRRLQTRCPNHWATQPN